MKILKGDLLESNCDIIVHQTNCLTLRPHGLAETLFKKYPYANVYTIRKPNKPGQNLCTTQDRDEPGTIKICEPENENKILFQPIVCNLFGQFSPGKPGKYYNYLREDTKELREEWFKDGLNKLVKYIELNFKDKKIKTIGFPYQIGCGLAAGDWISYKKMISDFENELLKIDKDIIVNIYKL